MKVCKQEKSQATFFFGEKSQATLVYILFIFYLKLSLFKKIIYICIKNDGIALEDNIFDGTRRKIKMR